MDILFFNFYCIIPDKSVNIYNTKLIVGAHPFSTKSHNKKNIQQSEKIYDKIPHEYYPEEELSINMKKLIKKAPSWQSGGFWLICLLLDKINIMKQLNIFGLDFCFNKYNIKYNSKNITPGHDMNSELSLFKELFQKYQENKKTYRT